MGGYSDPGRSPRYIGPYLDGGPGGGDDSTGRSRRMNLLRSPLGSGGGGSPGSRSVRFDNGDDGFQRH